MCAERLVGLVLAIICITAPTLAQKARQQPVPPDENSNRSLIDESPKQSKSSPQDLERVRTDLPNVDLQSRLKDVQITTTPSGDIVTVETDQGPVQLTAAEYIRSLALTKAAVEQGGFLYRFFNISKPWGFLWISIGLLGQVLFTVRMVLQWWASEKHKRSIVPVGFWWASLIGGMMLFVYFVWRKDIVGIIGQSTGVFVYVRNLVLIYSGKRLEADGAQPLEQRAATP